MPRFTTEFCKNFGEDLMPVLLKHINKIDREAVPSNSFLEESIALIPKPEKDIIKKRTIGQTL